MHPPRRILLAQTSFLGDVVLTTPLARVLAEGLADVEIWWLVRPDAQALIAPLAGRERVLIFDKRGRASGPRGLWRSACELRAIGFDAAIAVQRSTRTALLLALAGIPLRVGFAGAPAARLYHRQVAPRGAHARDRLLALAAGLGLVVPDPPPAPELRVDEDAAGRVAQSLRAAGIADDARLLVVAPGSAWATKRWPARGFAAASAALAPEIDAVVVVGGPGDAALAREIGADLAGRRSGLPEVVDLCGRSDTAGLVAAIARARLVIANDSAPGHVAAALGRPLVSIFGPTVPAFGFAPLGPLVCVVERDLDCRPCARHGGDACPIRTHACMESIEVASVADAARAVLARADRARAADRDAARSP